MRTNDTTAKAPAALMIFLLATLLASGHGASAGEVRETERGFCLGLKLTGSSLHADNDADGAFYIKDDGGGLQIDLGYRFNPTFALEFSVGGSRHETSEQAIDANIISGWLFGYYRFCPARQFRPFIKFGLGGHALEVKGGDAGTRIDGGCVAFGAGFRFFFNSHFSLGLDLTHNIIQYENAMISLGDLSYSFEIDEEGALTTLGVTFGYSF